MRRRKLAGAALVFASYLAVAIPGAASFPVVGACLLGLTSSLFLLTRGGSLPGPVVSALQVGYVVGFVFFSLVGHAPSDLLAGLLDFCAPLLLLRLLRPPSLFGDFLLVLLSLLLFMGGVAAARGFQPVAIAVAYLAIACLALPHLLPARATSSSTRLASAPRPGTWRAAPAITGLLLAVGGLLAGNVLFWLVPRISTGDREPQQEGPPDVEHVAMAGSENHGFPAHIRLGVVDRLKRNPSVALVASLTRNGRPYDPAAGEQTLLLLRAMAWDVYDPAERVWARSSSTLRPLAHPGRISTGDSPLSWSFEMWDFRSRTVLLPQSARTVSARGLWKDALGNVYSGHSLDSYEVAAGAPVSDVGRLPHARADRSDRRLLAVPRHLAAAIREVVPVGNAPSVREAVASLRNYFRGFRYTLEIPPDLPKDEDPVVAFLKRREGHCELFASAACLLLRLQGVPARVAGGFRCGERIGPGRYRVRFSNAHAWVEVPLLGRGFFALDFTPPDSEGRRIFSPIPAVTPTEGGTPAAGEKAARRERSRLTEPLSFDRDRQRRFYASLSKTLGGLLVPALWILAAGAAFLFSWHLVSARLQAARRDPLAVAGKSFGFYGRWLRACASAGHVRRRDQSPREFLASLPREMRKEGAEITGRFERMRYRDGGAA